MRRRGWAAVLVLVCALAWFAAPRAEAQSSPTLSISPNCGPAGTRNNISYVGSGFFPDSNVNISYDGSLFDTKVPNSAGNFSGSFFAPASSDGNHVVGADQPRRGVSATAAFKVPCPPPKTTTTTTTTAPPTTAPPPSAPRNTTTTTKPSTTTTTTTTTTVPGETTTIPEETTTVVTTPSGQVIAMTLDAPAIPPGSDDAAKGTGCAPNTMVVFTIDGKPAGTTTSNANGEFRSPLDVKDLAVGRYRVKATCDVVLIANLDVVQSSQLAPATGTLAVLIFFVLIGGLILRRQLAVDLQGIGSRKADSEDQE